MENFQNKLNCESNIANSSCFDIPDRYVTLKNEHMASPNRMKIKLFRLIFDRKWSGNKISREMQ